MLKFDLNWLHIGVVALANFMLGWLWYSFLFKKPWMKALKLNPKRKPSKEDIKKMPKLLGGAALTALLISIGTQVLLTSLNVADAGQGALLGLFISVFFIASQESGSLFEGRSIVVYGIGALHAVAVLVMDGAILAAWR